MTGAGIVAAVVAAVLGLPRAAAACPTCISSGFGDRSYNWAYLGLLLMPLVIAAAIALVLVWYAGWRPRHVAARIAAWAGGGWRRPARAELSPRIHTETP